MKSELKLIELFNQRAGGAISREEYWKAFRNFLEKMSDFTELLNIHGNKMSIDERGVIVEIKATRTHESSVLMTLDAKDVRSVPFSVLADGPYEPFQSDILVELGKDSELFLDIGANMGFYSLALAKENPNLLVQSFEPQPSVFKTLNANIQLNGLQDRVSASNIGLGCEERNLIMYVPKFTGTGGGSFINLHDEEGEAEQLLVPVKILDRIVAGKVDLIKIDVEGFELNVLKGAQKIIKNNHPTIMAELLRKWMKPFGHSPQMALEVLMELDYRCFAINADSVSEITKVDEETPQTNFIFVHDENKRHLSWLLAHVAK